ncbi:unnamed protein product [Rhodiola kirilowii]
MITPPSLLALLLLISSASATDFVFNGFNPSDLLLYGYAQVNSDGILSLTNDTQFTTGRALYPTKILTKRPNSSYVLPFSASFIFAMAPYPNILPGHGIVFLFVPFPGINGSNSAEHLGFLNRTNNGRSDNHVFGIEFDVFKNQEFNDIDDNHVGVNVNSLSSNFSRSAGYWLDNGKKSFKELKLNNGRNYQVWVDYKDARLNVSMAPVGIKRPQTHLLSVELNLSHVFLDEMYVGFTSATGRLAESHKILAWSFSNSNFLLSDELITTGLPSFVLPEDSVVKSKWFIAGVMVGSIVLLCAFVAVVVLYVRKKQKRDRMSAEMEEWEFEYWPHRMTYQEIEVATKGFSDENVIGVGGNGKVYKGFLDGMQVAVKCISHDNGDGVREFLAEISSLGRLKHRNLVGLRGWCKREKGSFMLVYDYMENGSLDKRVFGCDETEMLSYEDRIRVLKNVATGVLYLHEGWDSKVLHRDIKASNVLLDKEMNGRLGDFGLARMHGHEQVPNTTRVVGTIGYLAPEVIKRGRVSTQSDVFGFGILILEVLCGKRPIQEGQPPLVDWVWHKMKQRQLISALDERLIHKGGFDQGEAAKILHLGMLCAYPDPTARPTMRQVVRILEGGAHENDDKECEAIENCLLNPQEMWSKYPLYLGRGDHPTFNEIKESISSSMSLSLSDALVEGR